MGATELVTRAVPSDTSPGAAGGRAQRKEAGRGQGFTHTPVSS